MAEKLDILSSGICLLKRINLDVDAGRKEGGMGGGVDQ